MTDRSPGKPGRRSDVLARLNKLIDELAGGKQIEKILRK